MYDDTVVSVRMQRQSDSVISVCLLLQFENLMDEVSEIFSIAFQCRISLSFS